MKNIKRTKINNTLMSQKIKRSRIRRFKKHKKKKVKSYLKIQIAKRETRALPPLTFRIFWEIFFVTKSFLTFLASS
jgi:hypothetical protein